MKLYLAHYRLQKTKYMGDTTYEDGVRLVQAEDQDAALAKMEAEYSRGGPGDDSVTIWNLHFEEAL